MSTFEKPISSVQPDRFVYVVDYYLCKIIHNPFVSSGLILSCYAYYLATTTHSITHRDASSDILSNIINIIAVCRFLFKFKFTHLLGEAIFFLLQTITSFFILDTSAFSPLVVLSIYFQIFLPFVVILIAYANKSTLHEGLKSANNNFLPFYLSYSITLMNNQLWFNTTVLELAYSLSILSVKFYLIYLFILHEYVLINYEGMECVEYSMFYPGAHQLVMDNKEVLESRKKRVSMMKARCLFGLACVSILFDVYFYIA